MTPACFPTRLKLSPTPPSRITVSRATSSSATGARFLRGKRKRAEAEELLGRTPSGAASRRGGSGLRVSQQASATGSVSIEEVDPEGKFVQLKNHSDKVGSPEPEEAPAGLPCAPPASPPVALLLGQGLTHTHPAPPSAGPVARKLEAEEEGWGGRGDCVQVYSEVHPPGRADGDGKSWRALHSGQPLGFLQGPFQPLHSMGAVVLLLTHTHPDTHTVRCQAVGGLRLARMGELGKGQNVCLPRSGPQRLGWHTAPPQCWSGRTRAAGAPGTTSTRAW